MQEYELMVIFPQDEEKSKKGHDSVVEVLKSNGAEVAKDELFGDRALPYICINKTDNTKLKAGRFYLFTLKLNPDRVNSISKTFQITPHLVKHMFVALDEE